MSFVTSFFKKIALSKIRTYTWRIILTGFVLSGGALWGIAFWTGIAWWTALFIAALTASVVATVWNR